MGQVVFIGKLMCGDAWLSLSIPRGQSAAHNAEEFARPPYLEYFTGKRLGGLPG